MPKLSLLIHLNAYSDPGASNAPSLSNFKWTRDMTGIPASNPISEAFSLAPGETKTIFSGSRTLSQDIDTVYSISLKPLSSNTYRILNTAGTPPLFKTARAIATAATTKITAVTNGPIVTFTAAAPISAVAAQFVGQIGGMTTPVTIVALTAGSAGNVTLPIDGSSTINQLIVGWNTAHPSNQLQLQLGDDSQIPTGGQFDLTGGVDAQASMDMSAVQIGDLARIGDMFNVLNQGEYKIISKTSNSFTVENYTAVNEGPITLGSEYADQIRIYSSAGVQIGDTLVINQGFSPVTFGSYKITDVTDNYVEFYGTDVLPQETGISSALAIYSQAKNLIYLEADQKCEVTVNGTVVANMEPFIVNNSRQPGVFMLKSTVWSFSVANSTTDTAQCFVATVE